MPNYHKYFLQGFHDEIRELRKLGFMIDPSVAGIGTGALIGGGLGAGVGIMDSAKDKNRLTENVIQDALAGAVLGGGATALGQYAMPNGVIPALGNVGVHAMTAPIRTIGAIGEAIPGAANTVIQDLTP